MVHLSSIYQIILIVKTNITILLLLLITALISCEKQELEFSCDPEINKHVKDNKKSFAGISLDELNSYDISLQRAIFNSWDPAKKRSAWVEKLNSILVNEELNFYEQEHLNKLVDHISLDYFSEANLNNKPASRSEFAGEWISSAITDLHWNEDYIAFIVYRLYTNSEQFYQEISEINDLNKSITTDTETYDCNCNTSSDFCNTGACSSGVCKTVRGCGWLWSMECNGTCY